MRALIVAEYYPRVADPVLGVWTHRQALATQRAGVELRVLVLHRPLPPLSAVRTRRPDTVFATLRQPREALIDGLPVTYVRYLSPPRPWAYGSWGAWAAPALRFALRRLRATFQFDLIHAHYAVPAGDAVRRTVPDVPLVVSVHGGDLYGTVQRRTGATAVHQTLAHSRLVLANSAGTAERCRTHGARATRVVHLGTDLGIAARENAAGAPTLVTVGHLIARKGHADVIAALPELRRRHRGLRYVIVGEGPERPHLEADAARLGVSELVDFKGQVPHDRAVALARQASVFVLPSRDEAFGVAYVEAMAGGVPAIGTRGEDGPEEIAACGGGITLVAPGNVGDLTQALDALLSNPELRSQQGHLARATVEGAFTWEQCGQATADAYREALLT